MFRKIDEEEKRLRSEINKNRYKLNKLLDSKKPSKIDIVEIEEVTQVVTPSKDWLDIVKQFNFNQIEELAFYSELPIDVIRSLKLGVYKATDRMEQYLIYGMKQMGLYENTKS